jgi:hypothetical protein
MSAATSFVSYLIIADTKGFVKGYRFDGKIRKN